MANQHTARTKPKAVKLSKPVSTEESLESVIALLKHLRETLVCSSPDPVLTTRYFMELKSPGDKEES